VAGVVAIVSLLPTFADAQQVGPDQAGRPSSHSPGLQVTPYLGMYVPFGSLVADSTLRLRPVGAAVLGTRIAFQRSDAFALEASFAWSPNLIAQSDWKRTTDLTGGLWLTSLRGRIPVTPNDNDLALSITSGLGLIHRYGGAWRGMKGTTDASAVLGSQVRYRMHGTPVTFVFDMESFITRTGYVDVAGTRYGGHLHNDLVWSIGATIDVLGR
jgi:hypothetical protein